MPSPRNVDQHQFPGFIRHVQQFCGRHMIGANRIHAGGTHLLEIGTNAVSRRKWLTLAVRGKRAIRDPLNPQPAITTGKKLAVRSNSLCASGHSSRMAPPHQRAFGWQKERRFLPQQDAHFSIATWEMRHELAGPGPSHTNKCLARRLEETVMLM